MKIRVCEWAAQAMTQHAPLRLGRDRFKEKTDTSRSRLQAVLDEYRQHVARRPRMTALITSFTLACNGDLIAQAIERILHIGRWTGLDIRRTVCLGAVSGVWAATILLTWFSWLDRWLPRKDMRTVMAKVTASQFILQPAIYVPYFYLLHGLLMGDGLTESLNRMAAERFQMLLRIWAIYFPSYWLCFRMVPVDYQVLWISGVSLCFNVILSLFNHKRPAVEGIVSLIMDVDEFGADPFPTIGSVVSSLNSFGDEASLRPFGAGDSEQ